MDKMARKPLQCEPSDVYIVQDDEVAAALVFVPICTAPVFAPICTAPVFDAGGCIGIVSASTDCSATANVQNTYTAKRC